MERWQIELIENNMVQLLRNTTCTVELLSLLLQYKVFSREDYEDVQTLRTPLAKAGRLYEILRTKRHAYCVILRAFKETKQSGALHILEQSESCIRDLDLISIDTKKVVGKGRSGTRVYCGTFDGRTVAVKVVKVEPENALRDVNILKKLDDHENILHCYFAELKNNQLYIALELCVINLEDEIEKKLVKPEPYFVLKNCTKGLVFLHSKNIVHRDLKPANILFSRHGQVKISDFGCSKELDVDALASTASGVFGTTEWMPPELLTAIKQKIRFRALNTKGDIFSLGCVFYYVLSSGDHLYGDVFERPQNIIRNYPLWRTSSINDSMKQLIIKMVSQLPDERPSAEEILNAKCLTMCQGDALDHHNPIKNYLSLSYARELILKLTRPLAEISMNINVNKTIIQEELIDEQRRILASLRNNFTQPWQN